MMSTILTVLGVLILLLVVAVGWLATLLGLPGNWFILAGAAVYAWFVPADHTAGIGWKWIVALAFLAALGELLEFIAGAVGTTSAGGSRRSAVYALVGSVAGAVTGGIVGLPIPVLGSLVAVLLFGGLGAAVGAAYGEWSLGTGTRQTIRVSRGAFWGRLLGTGAKAIIGSVMVAAVVAALLLGPGPVEVPLPEEEPPQSLSHAG